MAEAPMFPLTCVLCPIDLSGQSRRALAIGAWLAKVDSTRLVVATFIEPLLSDIAASQFDLDSLTRDTEEQVRAAMDASVPDWRNWPTPPSLQVRRGEAHEQIVKMAAAERADLIVMVTHGISGAAKLLLGSVTERVLRTTKVPVLAVPYDPLMTDSPAEPVAFRIQRVTTAVDFSNTTDRVVKIAVGVARRFSAELRLTHVVEGDPSKAATRIHHTRAVEQLQALEARVSAEIPVSTRLLRGGTADEIAVDAAESKTSLVVMGLKNVSGFFADRPGAVAYKVMCLSAVPVLVVVG